MSILASFTINLEIFDLDAFFNAAKAHALERGLTLDEWDEWKDRNGISAALIALLDPGNGLSKGFSVLDTSHTIE